jgi:hypothetical protein
MLDFLFLSITVEAHHGCAAIVCGALLLGSCPTRLFGVGSIVQTNQTTLKLLMAATVERNVQESSATSPGVTRVEPAPTPPAPGPRRLGDAWHPWHSVAGLMGYGRRGTLRNKHIFTLCFKFVLGIGQVILKAYVHCVCLG